MTRIPVLLWSLPFVALQACCLKPVVVTGGEGPTANGVQAETAMSVNKLGDATVLTVTYNDMSAQAAVQFTQTSRTTQAGATLMGWSYSTDMGQTWTYGGRVQPNNQWPIIWGDPGITHSVRDQRYVFIANLALPQAKLAAIAPNGTISGPMTSGGACISRSVDGGKLFSLYQCVQTKEVNSNGDFYDGGNMASDGSGNIYAGWVNVQTSTIHMYRAASEGAQFQKLPNPFPAGTAGGHPRLRVDLDTGNLFVMALGMGGELLLARWNGAAWSATWHTGLFAQGSVCIATDGSPSCAGTPVLRTALQFSFDVGSFGKANDHIRVLFTRWSAVNQRLYIAGGLCSLAQMQCGYVPQWGTGEGAADKKDSSFNPLIRAHRTPEMIQNSEASLWMGSHETYTPANGKLTFAMGGVAMIQSPNNPPAFIYFAIFSLANRVVCADNRGYWGDYDDLQALGASASGQSILFGRTYTNSEPNCNYRWAFTSSPAHVGFTGP